MNILDSAIMISDLHLTDSPRDEYRWGLFPWLREQIKVYKIEHLLILGDITDAKDFHSSLLVNRLLDEINGLSCRVWILRGNHDGVDPDTPYFKFLDHLEHVHFISRPERLSWEGGATVFLPHSKNLAEDWKSTVTGKGEGVTVFLHATVNGAQAENGMALPGISADLFKDFQGAIYSGDVHVPQRCGRVEYVGSPYPVRFGDKFEGRAIRFEKGKRQPDLKFACLRRHALRLTGIGSLPGKDVIRPGDQVKVVLSLPQREALDWEKNRCAISARLAELGAEVCAFEVRLDNTSIEARDDSLIHEYADPVAVLRGFCEQEGISKDLEELGEELMKDQG